MKAFIVMPFADEFKGVYEAIKRSCDKAGIESVRADQILEPGPIINQIFEQISVADLVVGEVSSKNPNVYYEIALAHCRQLPTVLLANENSLKDLPFDIRHNRVLVYNKLYPDKIDFELTKHLNYIKENFIDKKSKPDVKSFLSNLGYSGDSPEDMVELHAQRVCKRHHLRNCRIKQIKRGDDGNVVVIVIDDFEEKVVFEIDVNGMIREEKRL